MALVEVARFLDLTEAQAAAGALRASGIPIHMQNENWGQTEPYLQLAMGGFRLWTPEEEAEAARAFLAEIVAGAPDPEEASGGPARAAASIAFPALLAPIFGWAPLLGWLFAGFRRRRVIDDG